MEFISFLIMALFLLLVVGIVMAVLSTWFVLRKRHCILSIIFAVLFVPCIYIPVSRFIGITIAKMVLAVVLVYGIILIISSIKNMRTR